LMSGDVLAGIFFGAFGVYFLQKLWAAKKPKFVLIGTGYFIVLGLAFVLLYNHMTHANMGGMDAFIGVIVGAALTMAIIGEGYVGASLIAFLFIGGVMIPPYMVNIEEAAFENDRIVIDDTSDAQADVEYISLDEILGNYKVDETISNISFVLGQEGETKGAFKSYSGEISINESIEESTFEILLQLDDLTTFNAMRDGSLMSEDYFDAENFPTMKYSGSSIEVVGENDYKIHGEFTMLGISKEIAVSLRCVETDNGKVLIGKGEIDRTLFGMPPSAEEGDVVSFDYTLSLVNN